jgi:NAD(P)-dependent dehydrogenase (short-subunit alcohol dehydrogenase family)
MTDQMIALVTGGNKGIGREIAAQLAQLGHTVIIGSRSIERGEQTAAELRAAGGSVTTIALDVTDPASVAAAAERVAADYGGRLDALINNAGPLRIRNERLRRHHSDKRVPPAASPV